MSDHKAPREDIPGLPPGAQLIQPLIKHLSMQSAAQAEKAERSGDEVPKSAAPIPAYVKQCAHPPVNRTTAPSVGGFTENFVLVKVPGRYFPGPRPDDMWVPAPRKELYQLEITRNSLDPDLLRLFVDVAETELKAIFDRPGLVKGNQRIPRVGRNALILAVLAHSGLDGLEGFAIEKDPAIIGRIMKQSLHNVVVRKRDRSDVGSEIGSESTEKGSVEIPAASGSDADPLDMLAFGASARVGHVVPRPFIRRESQIPGDAGNLACLPEDEVVPEEKSAAEAFCESDAEAPEPSRVAEAQSHGEAHCEE